MKYYVEEHTNNEFFDVFSLSNVDFEIYNNYDFSNNGLLVPPNEPCMLFITYETLINICKHDIKKWLELFFKNENYLIVDQKIDNTYSLTTKNILNSIDAFEKYRNQILFYYSGIFENNFKNIFQNLNMVKKNNSEFLVMAPNYYFNSKIQELKIPRSNNFLLTTIFKYGRGHRILLVEKLKEFNLLSKHIGKIHHKHNRADWVGDTTSPHVCAQLAVSWDLYNSVSFEIVPETLYENVSWVTEKTLKPIVAKIPFLVLSNKEYYDYLRSLGFKTFDSLIDESFAIEEDIFVRTEKLVKTANYILDNDALKFYEASKEICEHNFDRMLYLRSKEEYSAYMSMYNFQHYLGI